MPLTPDHPQACEPRCADVFKHYLACADRIEQKGAGAGAASLTHKPPAIVRHRRDRTPKKTRRRLHKPYFYWLKSRHRRAMPHIIVKLKRANIKCRISRA